MAPVLASLLALGLGPLLVAAARGRRWMLGLLDGFVVVTIGGIVLLHILPHAFLVGGWWMLALAAVGLFVPSFLERVVGSRLAASSRWMLPAALLGLALHALLDGTVLVEAHDDHGHGSEGGGSEQLMALGVILHRVPEGLAIWWFFRRRHGVFGALLALLVIAAATTLGFALGERLEGMLGTLHGLQVLVAGSLLHVVSHRVHEGDAPPRSLDPPDAHAPLDAHEHHDHHDHDDPGAQVSSALGALLGVALLVGVSLAHPASHRIASELAMGTTFLTLALSCAPALLLAYAALGVAGALWPARFRPDASPRSLAPLVVSLPLSLALLGPRLTLAWAAGLALLRVAGWLFGRTPSPPVATPSPAPSQRLRVGLATAAHAVDASLPWILLGLGLAAFLEPSIHPGALSDRPPLRDLLLFLALGIPLSLGGAGAAPLALLLLHKGLPAGAMLAFLWGGAAARLLPGPARSEPRSWLRLLPLVGLALVLSLAASTALAAHGSRSLHDDALARPTLVQMLALGALTLVALASLVRRGPRGWVEQIFPHP